MPETEPSVVCRPFRPEDRAAAVALNEAHRPEVGVLDDVRIDTFVAHALRFEVAVVGGLLAGLFIGLSEGLDYASPNYRAFAARHRRFAYVDRIVIADALRGTGLAQRWYQELAEAATASGRGVLCAEVNIEPRNDRSLRFHDRLGFEPVGELGAAEGHERVVLLERQLQQPQ